VTEGERESICIGGGETLPDSGVTGLTEAWVRKSCASCPSNENEFDERAEEGKSSNDVRREDVEVILLMPNRLGRFRNRDGPGSLSTVAKDIDDIRPMLCTSEDDIE
jgi:hypothetical protein